MSEEDIVKKLWDKLGNLYQSKSMVNKLFPWKKLYLLRMNDGDSVIGKPECIQHHYQAIVVCGY